MDGEAKAELLALIRDLCGATLDSHLPLLVSARRMTSYKRPHLLLDDPDRLVAIAQRDPFQVVFAGRRTRRMKGAKI